MIHNKAFTEFVSLHKQDDIQRLLFSADKYPGIDVRLAVRFISARKKIVKKVPSWSQSEGLIFSDILATEQCSSELTADYKKRFVKNGIVLDLTGGLGVDSFFMSKNATHLYYFDKNKELSESADQNFKYLGVDNITVTNCEITVDNIDKLDIPRSDLIYLDPARRDNNKNPVYALTECQPNLFELKDSLLSLSGIILVKVSPMVDILATIRLIPEISEIHILSVNNECKELLFLLDRNYPDLLSGINNINIYTVNFCNNGHIENFDFKMGDENNCLSEFADTELSTFLYEPNSSILKAGAFKILGKSFGLKKLQKNTHLYISENQLESFPGRCFEIKEVFDFNKATIKLLRTKFPKANISTRNFPLSPEELKKILRIQDGGDIYIFGCIVSNGFKKILVCTKVN
ncbi:MAG: SAM-dependent methyltransferase [Bacteroidales bacterium]|jgi:16S rRNA G966 N2-methylase RsmD